MTERQWVFAVATAALLVTSLASVRRPDRGVLRDEVAWATTLLFVVSAAVRLFYTRASVIHADMLGVPVLDSYLDFPAEVTFRDTHGQYGYFLVGGLARLLGRDADAVFVVMRLIGLVTLGLSAVLAQRVSGSRYGALFAVAVAGVHPALARVAASEDVHNVGAMLGVLALVNMDVYATSRRLAPLLATTLALCLLVHTRQTFYLFAPLTFLLGLLRAGPSLLRDLDVWAAGVAVLLVLVPRVLGTRAQEGDTLPAILAVLGSGSLAPHIFAHHAAFDFLRFGPAPVLTLGALVWAVSGSALARGHLAAFALYFLATYPCAYPSPGVQFAQRLPVLVFALLLAAVFGAALVERLAPERRRRAFAVSGALLLSAMQPAFPAFAEHRRTTPEQRELELVQAALSALPESFTLAILPSPQILYGHSRYAGMLRRAGKRVAVTTIARRDSARPPVVFLEGIECWTYTFRELVGVEDELRELERFRHLGFERVLFGHERSRVRPPPRVRAECAEVLAGASPLGPGGAIHGPEDDPPFVFYATDSVPVRFVRLDGAATP